MKTKFRVFQEPTGLWHICRDDLPYLDARSTGYPTKRQAQLAAKLAAKALGDSTTEDEDNGLGHMSYSEGELS